MKNEIWRPVPGWETYHVSNMGRVKSLKRLVKILERRPYWKPERILKQTPTTDGYLSVKLYNKGEGTFFRVHQIVCMAFKNHKPNGHELVCNHKNFDPHDNRLENLEIITQRENANKKHLNSSSKYVGVSWSNGAKKWEAYITINNKINHLGRFKDELDAREAYQQALKNIKNEKTNTLHHAAD